MVHDLEQEVRRVLSRKLSGIGEPTRPSSRAIRRAVFTRILLFAFAGIILALGATTTLAVLRDAGSTQDSVDPASGGEAPAPAEEPQEAQTEEKLAEQMQPTTPTTVVASGKEDGVEWSLSAHKATIGNGPPALCLNWEFGSGLSTGFDCFGSLDKGPPSGSSLTVASVTHEPEWSAVFGTINRNVERVNIQVQNGDTRGAAIYNPDQSLGADFDFYVGFAPAGEAQAVIAEDAQGNELDRENTTKGK